MKKLNKLTATILSTILVLSTGTVNAFAFDGEQDIKFADSVSVNNPVYHEGEWNGEYHTLSVPDYTDWSYVYFGSYPQSEVTDAAIINQIDAKLAAQNLTVGDVWIGNIKYRKIEPQNANSSAEWADINEDHKPDAAYRYFKWERIKWKVLQVDKASNRLLLWSDKALDCQEFSELGDTTWETSSLRKWLNGEELFESFQEYDRKGFTSTDFYATAFSANEHSIMERTYNKNTGSPAYPNQTAGYDTYDKVFPLSFQTITDHAFGFADEEHWQLQSNSRKVCATDYGIAMGINVFNNDPEKSCFYWLRTRKDTAGYYMISSFGLICGRDVWSDNVGVVPAISIHYSSNLWTLKNDGTSGSGGSILSKEEVQQKAAEEAKKEEEKQEKATLSLSLTGKITKLKKDSVTVKFTNKTSSSISIKTNDSKFKKKKTIMIKPGKSKSVKLKLKSKKLKKKKLKLKFKCNYAGKNYKITVNSKKVTVK